MKKYIRIEEYKVLIYRILLVYVFYLIARILFLIFNYELLEVDSISDFISLEYYGLAFDTTAILYINTIFILFSVLPFIINTKKAYQNFLFYLYFTTNLIGYATNYVDLIYYKFTYSRTTIAFMDIIDHETNKGELFFGFMINYWYVFVLFFGMAVLWIYLYNKVQVIHQPINISKFKYFSISNIILLIVATIIVGGIRGDFKFSTRPINLVDANRYITNLQHADVILNTPFTILRTFRSNTFKKKNLVSPEILKDYRNDVKFYQNNPKTAPNIVLFITESYGREYWNSFNQNTKIPNYVGYTPFLDSLAQHSLIFTNAFANGRKSIHGMSSVLAGIPSFDDAFTSSPYPNQKIQSLVSTLKEMGYDTSFFHGAPNGSMGFLGFGNILGFDHYYGKNEYNNDDDFDGVWGIWDEPFFQFMKRNLDSKKKPFFSTIFTISSHDPFKVPEKYIDKFPKGTRPIHQCVGYTDFSFKKFFEAAKKEPWFNNTIFIITADHANQIAYDEYSKIVNRFAVPILIYKPDESLKGVNTELAQQIDIYPTILDLIGYDKPFRSWGRSLVGDRQTKPFVINYNGNQYQYMRGNYITTFDGNKITGVYDINDKGLEKKLKSSNDQEIKENELAFKALIQDYYNKIIEQKLSL